MLQKIFGLMATLTVLISCTTEIPTLPPRQPMVDATSVYPTLTPTPSPTPTVSFEDYTGQAAGPVVLRPLTIGDMTTEIPVPPTISPEAMRFLFFARGQGYPKYAHLKKCTDAIGVPLADLLRQTYNDKDFRVLMESILGDPDFIRCFGEWVTPTPDPYAEHCLPELGQPRGPIWCGLTSPPPTEHPLWRDDLTHREAMDYIDEYLENQPTPTGEPRGNVMDWINDRTPYPTLDCSVYDCGTKRR